MNDQPGYRRPQPGTQPNHLHPPYRSSVKRSPTRPLVELPQTLSEITGPLFGPDIIQTNACDLTRKGSGQPLGERIIVSGRVLEESGRAVPRTLVELWQANAAGRYLHKVDQHDAPLDPNFTGCGHTLTDAEGRYRFVTIRPGAYPWRNDHNAWRPAHIHFSLFGPAFATRLVTQMYFPGDPLLPFDPVFNCTADESARKRLISAFDWETTIPEQALGYRFDIVLSGREDTPLSPDPSFRTTTSQTVGPFFHIGLDWLNVGDVAEPEVSGERVTISGCILDGDHRPVPDALIETWQANAHGKYAHPDDPQDKPIESRFQGYGRIPTDNDGRFRFTTIKPGSVSGPGGRTHAPHIVVSIFMRGLLKRLVSRIYFPDDGSNARDPVLNLVEPSRRSTLIARNVSGLLEWNVILQGRGETVFFDC